MKKSDKKKVSLWERYLTKEIGIEFKACLYFFGVLFYYCTYRLCIGVTVAEILHMAEMIFLTYAVGYLQVYVLWNFDEADAMSKKELIGIIICTIIYTVVSYIGNWFFILCFWSSIIDRNKISIYYIPNSLHSFISIFYSKRSWNYTSFIISFSSNITIFSI